MTIGSVMLRNARLMRLSQELDFKDSMNAAGGQYLSLADAAKVVQTILNPARPDSILTQHSVTQWLRAVHEFDEDQWTAIGMMWEIIKHKDTYGRLHKIFWKRKRKTPLLSAIH